MNYPYLRSFQLARRLFYSFVKHGQSALLLTDIAKFFPSPEDAEAAFALFDKDVNGDATLEEVELACMYAVNLSLRGPRADENLGIVTVNSSPSLTR